MQNKNIKVIVIPGGGGKSTLSKEFGFIDIDSYWDSNADEEKELIFKWQEAMQQNNKQLINYYIDECVLFKAKKCIRNLTEENNQVILVQSVQQAKIILDDTNNILCLVPTEDLHEKSMEARNDTTYVKDICRNQRKNIIDSGFSFQEYINFDSLKEFIKIFI